MCDTWLVECDNVELIVDGFEWDYSEDGNVNHLLKHEITTRDADAALRTNPLFREVLKSDSATHIMIGRDGRGRSLLIWLRATPE
jgi:hypothetical protein